MKEKTIIKKLVKAATLRCPEHVFPEYALKKIRFIPNTCLDGNVERVVDCKKCFTDVIEKLIKDGGK